MLHLPLGFGTLLLAHTVLSVPFVATTVYSRFHSFQADIIDAARDLGAGEYQVFRHVVLPLAAPAVLAGWLLSFTLSLDDVIISFFTTGPDSTTLPIQIFSMVRSGVSPDVNALSTLILLGTIGLVVLVQGRELRHQKGVAGK